MRKIKAQLKLMPIHILILGLSCCFSFISIFIPIFELNVQYMIRRVYSLFTLLIFPDVCVKLRENEVSLNFIHKGAVNFILALIISVAALTLVLGYNLYSANKTKRKMGLCAVLVLLLLRWFLHFFTLSSLITKKIIQDQNMTINTLFVGQNIWGNVLILVLFIGIVAALYGIFDMEMHYKLLSYPYMLWVTLFTILPLILIFFMAFFERVNGGYHFTLKGFSILCENKMVSTKFYGFKVTLQEYFSVFLRSLDYSVWTTIGCLLIGYPISYIIAQRTKRKHLNTSFLLILMILPMWMNTMLRTYAWRAILSKTGILNSFLIAKGIIDEPILFLKNPVLSDIFTKLVMINDFLPFMIMPIYTVLLKIDNSITEASRDLGASSFKTFTKVMLPLSFPGIVSGIHMVFMPSLTFFMIPDILSEGSIITIGNTVQTFILSESKAYQQAGNVLSLLLLIFVIITLRLLRSNDRTIAIKGGIKK